MKKILALLMAAVTLLCSTAAFAADAEFVEFTAEKTLMLVKEFDWTPEEWNATGVNRALLTFFVSADCMTARGDDAAKYIISNSHVGYSPEGNIFIIVMQYGTNSSIVMIFSPTLSQSSYLLCEGVSAEVMAGDLEEITFTANTKKDLDAVAELIAEVLR